MDEFLSDLEAKLEKANSEVVKIAFTMRSKPDAMELALSDVRRYRRRIKEALKWGCTCRERRGGHCPVHGSPA